MGVALNDRRVGNAPTFIQLLSPAVANAVTSLGRPQGYRAHEIISHQGAHPDTVVLLESGVVKITALTPGGHEVILGFRMAGELLGEHSAMHGLPRSGNVVGHETGTMLRIPAQRFREYALSHSEVLSAMLAVSGHRLQQSDIHRVSYAAHDVTYRIAATLLDWATRYGVDSEDGVRIKLQVTRRELSQVVAASEKSVDKVLMLLRRSGLTTTGRRLLVVTDIDRLHGWLRQRPGR